MLAQREIHGPTGTWKEDAGLWTVMFVVYNVDNVYCVICIVALSDDC